MLNFSLAHPRKIVLASMALFVASLLTVTQLGRELIPTLDEKDIAMHAMRNPLRTNTIPVTRSSKIGEHPASISALI